MATFTDNKGREWRLSLDAPKIKQIREACDPEFLLNDRREQNTAWRLSQDVLLVYGVLYILTEKQREERGVDQEDFYTSIGGDQIEEAGEALSKAILNFSPPSQRRALEASMALRQRLQEHGAETLAQKISDPNLERQLTQKLETSIDEAISRLLIPTSFASSGAVPSAFTPKDGP